MIENLQYAALRLVTGAKKGTSRELLLIVDYAQWKIEEHFINY